MELERESLELIEQFKPVQFCIKAETLALYQQAGSQTGYEVSVTAQEGEEIIVEYADGYQKKTNRVKVSPGFVQMTINTPTGQPRKVGYSPFWAVYNQLKKPQTPQS